MSSHGHTDQVEKPTAHFDLVVNVSGGFGHAEQTVYGRITRVRITPPDQGPSFQAHIEDELDGVFPIPDDGQSVVLQGTTSLAIESGHVSGKLYFFIDNTSITGTFKVRVWGPLRVYAQTP